MVQSIDFSKSTFLNPPQQLIMRRCHSYYTFIELKILILILCMANLCNSHQIPQMQCPANNFLDKNDLVCKFNCSLDPNTVGGNINPNECACKRHYEWDHELFACKINCAKDKNSNKTNLNLNQCFCKKKYTFVNSDQVCKLDCTKIKHSIGQNIGKNECSCQQYYKWNKHDLQCKYYIQFQIIALVATLCAIFFLVFFFIVLRKWKIKTSHQQKIKQLQLPALNKSIVSNQICSICLQGQMLYVKTNCGHLFHVQCITQWYESKQICPNCRNQPLKLYLRCQACLEYNIRLEEQILLYHKSSSGEFDQEKERQLTYCTQCKNEHELVSWEDA